MEIILLERIGKLGQLGETVRVRDGYARNYLLPQGKALRATPANMKRFERQRSELEVRNRERQGEAEQVATRIDGASYIVVRQAGPTGQLYGSVTTRDIAALVAAGGFPLVRSQVDLATPIKTIGLHTVRLQLHADVIATITVNIARSADEAQRQAGGEDLTQRDAAFAIEAEGEEGEAEGETAGEEASETSATEPEAAEPERGIEGA
jgi:large subunit ribosomal protein L9